MRILILHASVGGGHRSAAQALLEAIRELDPSGAVEARDVLEFTPALFRRLYAEGYNWLVNHTPEVWGYLYEHGGRRTVERKTARVVRAFDRINYGRFLRFIERFGPDVVVATHFLPSEILLPLAEKGQFSLPYYLVLTDHDAHALWIRRGPRCFFVGSEEVRILLEAAGIEPERIRVSGIPVSTRFRHGLDQPAACRALGIPEDAKVILLVGGASGIEEIQPFAQALAHLDGTWTLAVAGRNEELAQRFDELAGGAPRFRPYRFVPNIEALMSAAHVVVTKCGGLTTSECLALGKPMIIVRPTPGQEDRNADYLLESGAAWKARTPESLRWKVQRLWREPGCLERLSRSARALGRPMAAELIARHVLEA
jgi:processive 1,2-diacylglycerol beta-glucosyltransferase